MKVNLKTTLLTAENENKVKGCTLRYYLESDVECYLLVFSDFNCILLLVYLHGSTVS